MKKKTVLAILAFVVAAAGTIVPLLVTSGGRPTPEQVCQALVPQKLVWQDIKGVETAKDAALALTFQVSKQYVTVELNTQSPVFSRVAVQDLGSIGLFFDHYGHQRGEASAFAAFFGNLLPALQTYGEIVFSNNSGALSPQVFFKVGSYGGHTLYVGASLTGSYLFRVSR